MLPPISLGLWHNFGGVDVFEQGRAIIRAAFDNGITHIDLANNYGPPPGSAESNFGEILKKDFTGYLRDELIISTKAGYTMWEGPYGDWGSRKYLVSSLDQSLKRMGLEYVDIFYSHRPDPNTPLEETMMALDQIVRSGKALYAGISNYNADQSARAMAILRELGTPCLIHQARYSLFDRWVEDGLLEVLKEQGAGCIAFSPLAQGLLTDKYLKEIPVDSRMAKSHGHLQQSALTPATHTAIRALHALAVSRGQTLSQLALAWLLHDQRLTSVIIGVSSVTQLHQNLATLEHTAFDEETLRAIENILNERKKETAA
ncbi:aldo/keto reductase [Flavihumibacter petaseus NBRC 106054]|uniref:Aldo/keto reductase n=1 Tax=Flavihumibacter petaseus NBRC 106054 TaxID=1220578 RepID=A0A0E9N1P1_9BACT|nr:aldo/keto reductase [Flavihumibacter petaseus NBRC 106054]